MTLSRRNKVYGAGGSTSKPLPTCVGCGDGGVASVSQLLNEAVVQQLRRCACECTPKEVDDAADARCARVRYPCFCALLCWHAGAIAVQKHVKAGSL